MAASPVLSLHLFGRLRLTQAGAPLALAMRPRAQRLLVYLLLHRAASLARPQTAFALWPDVPESDSLGLLRRALSDLRRALPPLPEPGWLLVSRDDLRWNPAAPFWLDVSVYEHALAQPDPAAWLAAVNHYTAHLLLDFDDEWVLAERERLSQMQFNALRQLAAHQRQLGDLPAALNLARRALALDRFAESAAREVMELHYALDDRAAALSAYEQLRRLMQSELAVEPMPETQALAAAIAAGQVLPAAEPSPSAAARSSALAASRPRRLPEATTAWVDRESEMARLLSAWRQAAAGATAVILVGAPAGGGKTRLALEFGLDRSGPPAGSRWLAGHCHETTANLPYHPWIELLESYLAALGPAELTRLTPFARDYAARLLPGLARRLGRAVPRPAPIAGGELERLFAAVVELLEPTLSPGAPPILFVDDLQWADRPSLQLFHFLALHLRSCVLLGAYRSDELEDRPALQTLLSDLRREPALHLELPPLTTPALAKLVAERWPLSAQPPALARLAEATGGNPLFVVQVLDELAHLPAMPADLPVPAGVRQLVRRRLERLGSGRQVIEALAVFDGPASVSELRQISGRDEDEIVAALDHGLRLGLLQTCPAEPWSPVSVSAGGRAPLSAGPVLYALQHDLLRQAVAAELSEARRRRLSQRAADALAAAAHHLPGPQRQALAGRIWRQALAGDSPRLVFKWALPAAERAVSLHALDEAVTMLESAAADFTRLKRDGDHDGVSGERLYLEILLKLAALSPAVGRPVTEQAELLEAAMPLLESVGDTRLQALYHLRQADARSGRSEYAAAVDAYLEARAGFSAIGDTLNAAHSLYSAGNCYLTLGQNAASQPYMEQSLALFQQAGDVAGQTLALTGLALIALNSGIVGPALSHLAAAQALAQAQQDPLSLGRVSFTLAVACGFCYAASCVLEHADRAERYFLQCGLKVLALRARMYCGAGHIWAGDYVEGQRILEQVFADTRLKDDWVEGWTAQVLGRLALLRQDLPAAERFLEHAAAARRSSGELGNQVNDLAWLGRLRLAQGRPAEALAFTQQAAERLQALRAGVLVYESWDVLRAHAEALAANHLDPAPTLALAERVLLDFAATITDDEIRARFLAHPFAQSLVPTAPAGAAPAAL